MIDVGALLQTAVILISGSLLYPTLVLLLVCFAWIVLYAGVFCAEWLERARLAKCSPEELPDIILGGETRALPHRVRSYLQKLTGLLARDGANELQVENLLREATLNMWKSVDRLRIIVRLGPALGLMGTLIPMGTGLAALGQGDMVKLSADLVIAFTTTVVGLASGMLAFFFFTVKRRWIEEDLKNLELGTELLANYKGNSQP